MFSLFKKYFIPHKHNDHRPHILRWEATLAILSFILVCELYFLAQVFVLAPLSNIFSSVLPPALIDLTNANRQNDSLSLLSENAALKKAAQMKADDMAAKSYFAHTSPEGLTPWHWLEAADYKYAVAGENLAINFVDSEDIAKAWMNSPAHRANILNNNFTEIGIAAARGVYQGKETIFIVQFFGKPAPQLRGGFVSSAVEGSTLQGVSAPASGVEKIKIVKKQAKSISAAATPSSSAALPASSANKESVARVEGETTQIQTTPSVSAMAVNKAEEPLIAAKTFSTRPVRDGVSNGARLRQFLSNPKTMTNYLFIIFLTIISLALVLKIFIKIKIQHPALIINGMMILLIVASLMWLNQFLSLAGLVG